MRKRFCRKGNVGRMLNDKPTCKQRCLGLAASASRRTALEVIGCNGSTKVEKFSCGSCLSLTRTWKRPSCSQLHTCAGPAWLRLRRASPDFHPRKRRDRSASHNAVVMSPTLIAGWLEMRHSGPPACRPSVAFLHSRAKIPHAFRRTQSVSYRIHALRRVLIHSA